MTLILNAPAFSWDCFKDARDGLNLAKEKGFASVKMVRLFASVCQQGYALR